MDPVTMAIILAPTVMSTVGSILGKNSVDVKEPMYYFEQYLARSRRVETPSVLTGEEVRNLTSTAIKKGPRKSPADFDSDMSGGPVNSDARVKQAATKRIGGKINEANNAMKLIEAKLDLMGAKKGVSAHMERLASDVAYRKGLAQISADRAVRSWQGDLEEQAAAEQRGGLVGMGVGTALALGMSGVGSGAEGTPNPDVGVGAPAPATAAAIDFNSPSWRPWNPVEKIGGMGLSFGKSLWQGPEETAFTSVQPMLGRWLTR